MKELINFKNRGCASHKSMLVSQKYRNISAFYLEEIRSTTQRNKYIHAIRDFEL
jgi:hypothetical protein